jgi:hypothetical protein
VVESSNAQSKQLPLTDFLGGLKPEVVDLTKLFVALDIPLFKLDSELWKNWSQKYLQFKIPNRTTVMKNYIPILYKQVCAAIISTTLSII